MKIMTSFFFSCLFYQSVFAAEAVDTFLTKSEEGQWTVEYRLIKPGSKIAFLRNPNDARVKRWKPVSSDFMIEYIDNHEFIKRRDNSVFSQVSFVLEPSYTPLPKDYAPFSPFSDGGMLVHDGRFFACVEECDLDVDYRWNMELRVPELEHILVNGKIYASNASWQGNNSGSYIYVGNQESIDSQHVIALIDRQLPKELKNALSNRLPKMMDYFVSKFGKVYEKPSLFASYEKVNHEGVSTQGGVLPNQIFMHWSGLDLEKHVKNEIFRNDMVWFFAHEVAHLYQKENSYSTDSNHAWLHEGGADKFALEALKSLNPELDDYYQYRLDKFKKKCRNGVMDTSLNEATKNKKFKLHYNCGFLIHHSIDKLVRDRFPHGDGIFDVWIEYKNQIKSGETAGKDTYFKIVTKFTDEDYVSLLEGFIVDSRKHIDKLIGTL